MDLQSLSDISELDAATRLLYEICIVFKRNIPLCFVPNATSVLTRTCRLGEIHQISFLTSLTFILSSACVIPSTSHCVLCLVTSVVKTITLHTSAISARTFHMLHITLEKSSELQQVKRV